MRSPFLARAARRTPPAVGGPAPALPAPQPLQNTALLTLASLAAKGCGFVLLLVALNTLDTSEFGDYNAALAFVALFAVVTDLGLSTLAVRDVAQDHAQLPRYVGNLLALRLVLSLVTIVVCIVLAATFNVLQGDATVRLGVVVWALGMTPIAIVGTVGVVFQSLERMATLSALTTITAALTSLLGCAVLLFGGTAIPLLVTATVVNVVMAGVALVLAARVTSLRPRMDLSWWPSLVRSALPFAVLTLLNVLYSRADMVLVIRLKNSHDAGLYSVAYRLVDTLLVVAISPFNAAALPAFNRIAARSADDLRRLVLSGLRITLVIGVPVAVAATAYAPTILTLVARRSDYLAAVPALRWLAWSFPCFTVLAILYNAIYAAHRAGAMAVIFGLTLVFNVALNLLLIPRYGYFASAALTTASEALNVALAGWVVARHVVNPLAVWPAVAKTAVAAAAMGVVLWLLGRLGPVAGLVVGLPVGGIVYLAAVRALRIFDAPERAILSRLPLAGRYARWL